MIDDDHPRVFVPPPLIFCGLLTAGLVFDHAKVAWDAPRVVAIIVFISGLGLIAIALGLFRSNHTRPEPLEAGKRAGERRHLSVHAQPNVSRNARYMPRYRPVLPQFDSCSSYIGSRCYRRPLGHRPRRRLSRASFRRGICSLSPASSPMAVTPRRVENRH